MLQLEQQQHRQQQQQQRQVQGPLTPTRAQDANPNELLDRENHMVVELVTENEWMALQETGCWPRRHSSFSVSITVTGESGKVSLSTVACQQCDTSGSATSPCISVKNRTRGRMPKSAEKPRVPAVEF
jgi:hypothetical protein